MFIIATLSSIGLPGLNGFIGEFMILAGTFVERPWIAIVAASGVILGAVYMLTLAKRFLFGPLVHEENRNIADLSAREVCYLAPIVVLMFWIGLYPKPLLELIDPSVQLYVQTVLK
ncbi:MAG: proton-conducting transporter membrane subunit [Planctomycetota bacterium]